MYWQQKGDYLGVKVDRYTKSKKVSTCICNFILIKCTSRSSDLDIEYSLTCTVYSVVVLWYGGCFPLTHSECVVLNHLTPRTDQWFSPLAVSHFLLNLFWETGVRSRLKIVPDKFKYSYYLFAWYCMDIIGRSCTLITSGSWMAGTLSHISCYIFLQGLYYNLELFRVRERQIPVDVVEMKGRLKLKANVLCLHQLRKFWLTLTSIPQHQCVYSPYCSL